MFEPGLILQERYRLQQRLGRSAPGRQTWLATDLTSHSDPEVIIKLLVFTDMQWQDLKLFEREAQVLKTLDHPKIPQYRNYFQIDQDSPSALSWWGLVQDYIPGESLQTLLDREQRWSESEICRISQEVLQILEYLHGLYPPVLHRDIKPSNLILDQAKQIWLVDFGAVQDQAAVTGISFTVVGTVGYAPLEQFWGRAVAASDLYALGATLIHLLTGVAPADLPQRDLRLQFSDRTTADSTFVGWLERLTEPALEHRFTTAHEARQALEERKRSRLTPVNRTNTLRKNSVKSYQRLDPHIVIKRKTNAILEIAIHRSVFKSSINPFICFILILLSGFLLLLLGIWGFLLGLVAIFRLFIAWDDKRLSKEPVLLGSIQLDRQSDRFIIQSKRIFRTVSQIKSGKISDIRYLSIHPRSVESVDAHNQIALWRITIRADDRYTLRWELREEECIWLVNEIENWLNIDAAKR
jgi:serine/threonine protein kinase